jgi:putative sigma-54 modulation protein
LSRSLVDFVERRMGFALGRFAAHISRVTIRLEDLNGPRGGLDQQCRIDVALIRSGRLIVRDTGKDIETAVSRAADRVAHRVRTALDRRRTRRRTCSRVPELAAI